MPVQPPVPAVEKRHLKFFRTGVAEGVKLVGPKKTRHKTPKEKDAT